MRKYLSGQFFLTLVLSFFYYSINAQNDATPDASMGAGLFNNTVHTHLLLPDGKILLGGEFTSYKNISTRYLACLNPDGTLHNSFIPDRGTNGLVTSIARQTDGKIIIGGNFTTYNDTVVNRIVRINTNGTIDTSFHTGAGLNNGVTSIAIQTDGKIMVGGYFSQYLGISAPRIMRLNADGTRDNTFSNFYGINGYIYSFAFQPDGKIIIGGMFDSYEFASHKNILRVNTDGSVDNTFNKGTAANDDVYSVQLQPDGKILIGGDFTNYNGTNVNKIVRLNTDGTLDNTFSYSLGIAYSIRSVLVSPSGKIIIAGNLSSYSSTYIYGIAQLNADGTVDAGFNANAESGTDIRFASLQPDGKILLSGAKIELTNKTTITKMVRLNTDGTLDTTFDIGKGANKIVRSILEQPDGKILIVGDFTGMNYTSSSCIARLNPDGTTDPTFNSRMAPDRRVNVVGLQQNGKIIVAGNFIQYDGVTKMRMVRLNTDGSLDNTFDVGDGPTGGLINHITVQPDDKIIVCGDFYLFNYAYGISRYIVRLNPDGSVDNTFRTMFNSNVNVSALQSDGKIIVGGYFGDYDGRTLPRIARLNTDGSIDTTFQYNLPLSGIIRNIKVLEDDKILMCADKVYSNDLNGVVRLNPDGSVDRNFTPCTEIGITSYGINTINVQASGHIIVGGKIDSYNGIPANNLVRLTPEGNVDPGFTSGITGFFDQIYCSLVQSNGKIIIAGDFTSYDTMSYNYLVRLRGDSVHFNTIRGTVFSDLNNNCAPQSIEKKIPSVIIKALPGPYYGNTDQQGNYKIKVDSGSTTYTLSQLWSPVYQKILVNQCSPSHTVVLNGAGKDTSSFDFADSIRFCTDLTVDIQSTRRRRCFRNLTTVSYGNNGIETATNVSIKVIFPDYVSPISSIPAWTSIQNKEATYSIASIAPGQTGKILIVDSVHCGNEEIRGLTQCTKAIISPIRYCEPVTAAWDSSSVRVNGRCQEEEIIFEIINAGAKDMADSTECRLYRNDTLVYVKNYKLVRNGYLRVNYPGSENTIRLETSQRPGHPGSSKPSSTIEACNNNLSVAIRGHVNSMPQNNEERGIAASCMQIIDSFDPNEKEASPIGWGPAHTIRNTDKIDFTIHFQNTGSDTAYTVKIVDTIDTNFDISTFVPGTSSHPYTWYATGKAKPIITFVFNNIQLPDSTTNQLGSNGFVRYSLQPLASLSDGTSLENKAGSYFDYNSAIITNSTLHTIGSIQAEDLFSGDQPIFENGVITIIPAYNAFIPAIRIYPNPVEEELTLSVDSEATLTLYNSMGIVVLTVPVKAKNNNLINLETLAAGIYLYEIKDQKNNISTGKLLKK